ncbi:hypothetical protein [Methylococcus mesophilus]|uniref:hypothetical protein n=1 Tax=Methylococcus mesophilus TaxID=2993564 RepID=UPI00224ACF29|nr:hypothetical protein [Methylococcus mesophilus]UZR27946.1 hypothetical protein OOT43_14640 [Methylococcus mesophilus]
MKRKLLVCAIAQTCILGSADGSNYTWQEGAGRLAYSVFNLSGNDCNMDPYTAGANGYAPSGSPAQAVGWNSSGSVLSFFLNPLTGFLDPDPINPPNQSQTGTLIPAFASAQTFETSQEFKAGGNAIAIADSWLVPCLIPGTQDSYTYMVMANMASAGSGFSNIIDNDTVFDNSQIDPPFTASDSNPGGAGFVNSANAVFNFNVDSGASYYQATGGLWSGLQPSTLNTPASGFPAVNAISAAMYPINLASYTTSESSNGVSTNYNPIFGGFFTLAIGDPFIVSSFNAKILWFLAASIGSPSGDPAFQWNDSSFPFSKTSTSAGNQLILAALNGTCSGCTPVFGSSTNAEAYTKWLIYAPHQAAYEVVQSFKAANSPTLTFWGKLFEGLWSATAIALDAAAAVETGGASAAAQIAAITAVSATTGSLTSVVDNGISNTFAQPTPTYQTAPLVVNSTYSASNLLGMLLANYAVQSWVQVLGVQPFNEAANPLWANFSIYTESLCSNLQVSANQFSSSITCQKTEQSSLSPPPTYNNVYTTTAGSNSSQLNIWDAILTGSNVTAATNQTSTSSEANGMLVLANPLTASFQPPTQIASDSDGVTYSAVTTNFNLSSGSLSLTDAYAYTNPPSAAPTIESYTYPYPITSDCSSMTFSPTGVSYTPTSGVLTVSGWSAVCNKPSGETWEGQATAMLNMATCTEGSAVQFGVDVVPPSATNQFSPVVSSVSLECATPNPNLVSSSSGPSLDYNQCVSDINATGGVVAMPINGSPGLACVCIPGYLAGSSAQLTTGVSTVPSPSPCPSP